MALIHKAHVRPTKLELLAAWLPGRSWYAGPAEPARVAAYRFDDPDGEVGIETLLVGGDGDVHQVPLTYRGAPLAGADEWLIGTTEHSVLGRRWVYDACGDPVYAAALARAVLTGGGQAEELMEVDARLEPRALTMTIASTPAPAALSTVDHGGEPPVITAISRVTSGHPTVIETPAVVVTVLRRLDGSVPASGAALTGTWHDGQEPVVLAIVTPR